VRRGSWRGKPGDSVSPATTIETVVPLCGVAPPRLLTQPASAHVREYVLTLALSPKICEAYTRSAVAYQLLTLSTDNGGCDSRSLTQPPPCRGKP
jgi:hypothetical protein